MKRTYITAASILLVLLQACQKDQVQTPAFEAASDRSNYKAGDTVIFNFSGNPDHLNFYSGEPGKRYEYRNRTKSLGTTRLQFTTTRANGSQENSLGLLVSADYAGAGSSLSATVANITAASWSDVTSRATLSTGSAAVSSVDLTDFAAADKPVFIAFKYTAQSGSTQNKWTITALTLSNQQADGTSYTLANLTATAITNYGNGNTFSPGWAGYTVSNNFNWVVSSGSSLVITGATSASAATAPAEAWVIMGPVDLQHVSPDLGTFLKGIDTRLASYSYIYSLAGSYTPTFVATNRYVRDSAEVVKKLTLTVAP